MNQAAIIIPVHNRRDITLTCLRHLRATGDLGRFRIIVVDDGSTDGTGEAIRAEFSSVEILRGDGQLWWTGAIALGMQQAFGTGAGAVCWLNDDCLPSPGTLQATLAESAVAPGQIVAPVCFNAETRQPVPNAFSGRIRVSAQPGEKSPADGLSGFCVAVPRTVWSRLGLPDARRFPHYYGDNAYTLRAVRAGFPVILLGATRADLIAFQAPPVLAALNEPKLSWRENWSRIFVSPKSPYRLRTLFAFQRLKQGWLPGTAIALARSSGWIVRLLWLRLTPGAKPIHHEPLRLQAQPPRR